MILTKRCVYVHQPKTGGTFVTRALRRLHRRRRPGGSLGRLLRRLGPGAYVDTAKHGTCGEIPPSHRGLPILGTIRNPYDRYVSQYEYGWWKTHFPEWIDFEGIRRRRPSFPDLTFEEFLDEAILGFRRLGESRVPPEESPGLQSEQFVRYYFRDPAGAFPGIGDAYVAERRFERDVHPVRFLHTESLNRDLHDALVDLGYPPASLAFILGSGKVLPPGSRRDGSRPWESYYTPERKAMVRRREGLLFAMFPEYDV